MGEARAARRDSRLRDATRRIWMRLRRVFDAGITRQCGWFARFKWGLPRRGVMPGWIVDGATRRAFTRRSRLVAFDGVVRAALDAMETAIKTMRESQNWSTAYAFILLEDLMRVGANWIGFGAICIPRRETPSGSSAPTRAEPSGRCIRASIKTFTLVATHF